MSLSIRAEIPAHQNNIVRADKRFAIVESRAELDTVCNMPITKNIGDSMKIVSAKKLGANWRGFIKSKNDPDWACYSEIELIASDFIKYIADKSPASDPIHDNLDNPQVILDAALYAVHKINIDKLEKSSYLNDKARLFGALLILIPSMSEQVYKGINRSIKYFDNQRDNFSYLSDEQFKQFQADYSEKIKAVGPGIVDAITTELKGLLEGVRNV